MERQNCTTPPVFPCVNCDLEIPASRKYKVFCSDLCKDEADYVRYFRKQIFKKTDKLPDIALAIRIRRTFVLSGGYKQKERKIPASVRKAVIARDNGVCVQCGAPGSEIDHIKGPSSELSNLQPLCDACHNEKTIAGFVPIDMNDPSSGSAILRGILLDERVRARKPTRNCDDYRTWAKVYKKVIETRRKEYHRYLAPFILPLLREGTNYAEVSDYLTELGIRTFFGNKRWNGKAAKMAMDDLNYHILRPSSN